MKRFASIGLMIALAGCASNAPAPLAHQDWTYIGNDPAGTQNILMASATPVPVQGELTTTFRFQYTAPRNITGEKGKSLSYIESREEVRADCAGQTLRVLDESYWDVDGTRLPASAPAGSLQRVIPGGINDIMYQAVCGRAVGWAYIGSSGNDNQKIYIMGKAAGHPLDTTIQAWFKTEYEGEQNLIAAPSMQYVSYATKVSTLNVNCATYEIAVSNEVYYDTAGHKVFDIQPQPGEKDHLPATAESVRGLMYQAACGRGTNLRYLGFDPHHSQKVYAIGVPELNKGDTAQAHFRIYYMKPGTLTTGPVLHTISYNQRSVSLEADCDALTIQVQSEAYLDKSGNSVFTITPPPGGAPTVAVAPGSLSEMLWQHACHSAG